MSQPRPDFLNLSVAERIQLAEDIWDSIAAEGADSASLSAAQRLEIQNRVQAHDKDPSTALPWEQVRAELFQRNH
jgi:putative addiction module component (TIGR02574 family)